MSGERFLCIVAFGAGLVVLALAAYYVAHPSAGTNPAVLAYVGAACIAGGLLIDRIES